MIETAKKEPTKKELKTSPTDQNTRRMSASRKGISDSTVMN